MYRIAIRLCVLAALFGGAVPLHAQGLRGKLTELFTFGNFDTPLRLLGPADGNGNSASAVAVNDGFVPDASQANALLLAFLTNWMRGTVASTPVGSAAGGATFSFQGGTPVKTPLSSGPIVGEIGRTLGRGRIVVGANQSAFRFNTLRGVPLDNLRFNLTHGSACNVTGASCAGSGAPASASDIVELRVGLDFDLAVTSLFLMYGLRDRVDVGVVIPVVHASLDGTSQVQVLPFSAVGGGRVATFLAGTPENPVLATSQSTRGSATGIGDIGARAKVNLMDDGRSQIALLGDVRLPTGDEENLLGAGELSARALGIASTRIGDFVPFANLGYRYWAGGVANDALLATVGFDQLLGPRTSFAASLISEFQVGESVHRLPDPVTVVGEFARVVRPAELPDIRDDAVSVALGFKFATRSGLTAVVNGMVPVQRGGPRPDLGLTAGVEYAF